MVDQAWGVMGQLVANRSCSHWRGRIHSEVSPNTGERFPRLYGHNIDPTEAGKGTTVNPERRKLDHPAAG